MFLGQMVSQVTTCPGFIILLKLKKKKSVTEKIISDGKKISENMNDLEDPLNIYRSTSNEELLFLIFQM